MRNRSSPSSRARGQWLWPLGVVLFIVALLLAALIDSHWNAVRPWINRRVTETLQRPFSIDGDLRVHWIRDAGHAHWLLPRPRIEANDIRIGYPPDWNSDQPMARIGRLTLVLDPPPLLYHKLALVLLQIDRAHVDLERRRDGSDNWSLGGGGAGRWQLALDQLILRGSVLRLRDAPLGINLDANLDSNDQGLTWTVNGSYGSALLNGRGSAGSVQALADRRTPYPVDARLSIGKTRIDAKGTLTDPSRLAALDLQLRIEGVSMAQLYPISHITLPETPPYKTAGRMRGKLDENGGTWIYENFSGSMGGSDLAGSLTYRAGKPRPSLSGEVRSKVLDFADLAPFIGADSNAQKQERGATVMQPGDKVLPVEPFKTDRWRAMDADVRFEGRKILRPQQLPIDNMSTHIKLQDGVLTLDPLQFGIAGGTLKAGASLDSRRTPLAATLKISARQMQLKQLFPASQSMQASLGALNGDATLSGSGDSIAAQLGSANGGVQLLIDRGTVSKFILEAAGLNVANVVLTRVFGDRQINIRCGVADFAVADGSMRTRLFRIDTDEALIDVDGDINLNTERLNLTVKPQSKGVRVLSWRAPLYVTGTMKNPNVGVDKGVLALRTGAAAALGAVALPAALLPLVGTGSDNPAESQECVQQLVRMTGDTH